MAAGRDTTPQTSLANKLPAQDSESTTALPPRAPPLPTPPPNSSRTRRRKGARGQIPTASDLQVPSTALSSPRKGAVVPTPKCPPPQAPPIDIAQTLGDKVNHILVSVATTVGDVCKGVMSILGFILTVFRVPMYVS
jgi:hypothetical protein